jgi:hypothetical protein
MVIARTDLDVPTFLLLPGTGPRRRVAVGGSGSTIRQRFGMLSRRAAATVTGVFSRPDRGDSALVRHQPTHRPDFLEGAAMGREMFRL